MFPVKDDKSFHVFHDDRWSDYVKWALFFLRFFRCIGQWLLHRDMEAAIPRYFRIECIVIPAKSPPDVNASKSKQGVYKWKWSSSKEREKFAQSSRSTRSFEYAGRIMNGWHFELRILSNVRVDMCDIFDSLLTQGVSCLDHFRSNGLAPSQNLDYVRAFRAYSPVRAEFFFCFSFLH